ncbi:MAG: phosphatase PAP2 family protein [Bacteroidales bacterium]|nr:phosphatase PAP2 family protein [Bacteroidales bacterium]
MKRGFLLIIICSVLFNVNGQDGKSVHEKVYKINYKIDIPVTAGLFAINYYGFNVLRRKPTLDINQINALNINDVWAFDRRALEQSYSYSARESALTASDWGMNISIFLPVLLFLDKKIRKDWLDIALLYLETQAINSNLYTWGGPMLTNRIRPLVYYDEVALDEKTGSGTTNSFFSGHTSWTAGASFFMAKVISDYHPELGAKKWLLFAVALIPPTFVGYQRYRGLKHFPTDIAVGTAVGAAVGVLTPHLHKNKENRKVSMSLVPYSGQYSGLAFKLT